MEECLLDSASEKMDGLCVDIPYIAFSWFLLLQISLFYDLPWKQTQGNPSRELTWSTVPKRWCFTSMLYNNNIFKRNLKILSRL